MKHYFPLLVLILLSACTTWTPEQISSASDTALCSHYNNALLYRGTAVDLTDATEIEKELSKRNLKCPKIINHHTQNTSGDLLKGLTMQTACGNNGFCLGGVAKGMAARNAAENGTATSTMTNDNLSKYRIQVAINDETFIINSQKFTAKTYCFGHWVNDNVIFLEGKPNGLCTSAKFYNLNRKKECSVWCEM